MTINESIRVCLDFKQHNTPYAIQKLQGQKITKESTSGAVASNESIDLTGDSPESSHDIQKILMAGFSLSSIKKEPETSHPTSIHSFMQKCEPAFVPKSEPNFVVKSEQIVQIQQSSGAEAVSFLGLVNACGNETILSKIAKCAFEFIWAHEIANGLFRNGEYSFTGYPSPMTGMSKKPLDPAKVSLLKGFM